MAKYKQYLTSSMFRNTSAQIAFWIIIVLAVNILSSYLFVRVDITEDSLYSLSQGTKQIAKKVTVPTKIIFYFSKNTKKVPLAYKSYGDRVAELLSEYVAQNPAKLSLKIENPEPDSDAEEWAKRYNVKGVGNANDPFYMGLVFLQGDRSAVLPFLDPNQETLLEYKVSQSLIQVAQTEKRKVGILSSLPITGSPANQMLQRPAVKPWAISEELSKQFQVVNVPQNSLSIPKDINMLFVVNPSHFSDTLLYAIDQFVLRGGKLMLFLDPSVRILMGQQQYQHAVPSSQFAKLLKHWGVAYDPTIIVGEESRATEVGIGQGNSMQYSLWQTLDKTAFNTKLPALTSMQNVILPEAGFFTVDSTSPLKKVTPLIYVTKKAKGINAALAMSQNPFQVEKMLQPLDLAKQPTETNDAKKEKAPAVQRYASAILQGQLTTAFDAIPQVDKNTKETFLGTQTELKASVKPAEIVITTDVDFLSDVYSVRWLNLGTQRLMMPQNNNLAFISNITEFLNGLQSLADVRSRGVIKRPFTRFEKIGKKAQIRYQAEVERIQAKLQTLRAQLSSIETQTDKAILTSKQLEQVNSFKAESKRTQTKLREIRKLLRKDIENEKNWIITLNLLVVPLILILVAFIIYRKRFTMTDKGEDNVA